MTIYLPHEVLKERAQGCIVSHDPFLHTVIDDFLPEDTARALAAAYPDKEFPWELHHECREARVKRVCSSEASFPERIREAMWFFNSATFLAFLEELLGLEGLIVDPTHRGCGLHSTGNGGFVLIHSDSSRHPNTKVDQRLNMIYWLTPEWRDEWGGNLELWDRQAAACQVSIAPKFNRAAFFETSTTSFHGHPHPIQCPDDVRRNSLAVYYYEAGRPVDEHHAGWRQGPDFDTPNAP